MFFINELEFEMENEVADTKSPTSKTKITDDSFQMVILNVHF